MSEVPMETEEKKSVKNYLKEIFGYDSFRGMQEKIIYNVLDHKDTFVIMPTGAGKSMCYQLPALLMEGTAIVISPLIALMKNQVDQLQAVDVKAKFFNSSLSKGEMKKVKEEVVLGKLKLLYLAPESLVKQENLDFIAQSKISFVAIDEAHCISEWGHDFRPEYRKIRETIAQIGDVSIIALTATATPKVQGDIQKNLSVTDATLFKSSFNRTNLYYTVRSKKNIEKNLIRFVKEHSNQSGIIYCLSRKKVEEIAKFLVVNGIKAKPYHAGMDSKERIKNQDEFLSEDIDVIVATIAFGMGIDKPDVRFVIHYDVPKSIEGYYQETGRAGRDGIRSECLMFYSYKDLLKLEKFNKDKSVKERENARILLNEVAIYSESATCRRKQLLHYFGEEYKEDNCDNCDNCKYPKERLQAKEHIEVVLKIILETEEKFEIRHLIDVLMGKNTKGIKSYKHDQISSYGKGKEMEDDEDFWFMIIRQSFLHSFLKKSLDNPLVFFLSPKGKEYLQAPYPFWFVRNHNYTDEEEVEKSNAIRLGHDEALFNSLKSLRRDMAKRKKIPPYVVFSIPSLEEMATLYPTSFESLKQIVGVGESKAKKFGVPFLQLIEKYVEDNDIITASDVIVKTSGSRKSKDRIYIIHLVDKKEDFEDIASSRGITYEKLIHEIEMICYSGTKLNINYYIDQLLDKERQQDIYNYFLEANSDSIDEALEELGGEYSEDEIRLMRVKFMSEYAN